MKTIATISVALLLNLTIVAQNTITTDSILQLSTCAGGSIFVRYASTGSYSFGNQFIAQLSNKFGQFTNPVNIGQAYFNVGFILATIPQNTNFGFLYKIRVVSTIPAVIGTSCPNTLIITQIAQLNKIIAIPSGDYICPGDTVTLTAINIANSYLWSTGDTAQSIKVTQSGIYSVVTTDILTCQSTASDTLYKCTNSINKNILSKKLFIIYPNPTTGKFTVQNFNTEFKNYELEIYNLLGEKIYTTSYFKQQTSSEIDLSNNPRGIYFVKIYNREKNYVEKIVIQ